VIAMKGSGVFACRALLRAKQEAGRPKDRIDFDELTKLAP
jgi:hypothetical protein